MDNQDIRWKQRFTNFNQAFLRLKEAMEKETLNELERNGLVQRFKFTLELGWKTLKDFLEFQEFDFKPSPKETLRLAQKSLYIDYAQELIDGLELRNILSHDYSGKKFIQSENKFKSEIYPAIVKLHSFLLKENNNS